MPKKTKSTKTPRKLIKAPVPAVNLVDELRVATEILSKQRAQDNAELEYATVTTTKVGDTRDINDEFMREHNITEQAKQAAIDVLPRLEQLGIPTDIPKTYKGEMVKDDKQMARVRDSLKSKKSSIDNAEKMKKLRELKKIGKKIQEEVLRKRSKDKKDFLEKVKKKPVADLFDD